MPTNAHSANDAAIDAAGASSSMSPSQIRDAMASHAGLRERDIALTLGISEAQLVAAQVGRTARRIATDTTVLLNGMEALGEVMALTRNEHAVHEKIGVYDKIFPGKQSAMVLGSDIDLRMFPAVWASGFAVEKRDGDDVRRSLQFFDRHGDAVHKIHLRPASNVEAYERLVAAMLLDDQSDMVEIVPADAADAAEAGGDEHAPETTDETTGELRRRWAAMTDVHQFIGILRSLKMTRHQAVQAIGSEFAWQLDGEALPAMLRHAVHLELPIMCFVGSRGCIQIHSGPIANIKTMGPWLNIMDPTFHLHLRVDRIAETWAVCKPAGEGHVTSLEAYDAEGHLIIQFFGKRKEGERERDDWRFLMDNLPRDPRATAA